MSTLEERQVIGALLLAVEDQWHHNQRFSDEWHAELAFLRGMHDEDFPPMSRKEVYRALVAMAMATGVDPKPHWHLAVGYLPVDETGEK